MAIMIGTSPAMQSLRRAIEQVASTDATVLIQGETGTGKELIARTIHDSSQRQRGPFIAVSGVALAPSLLVSELFGHEAGSFTGASKRRVGRFEQAEGGTLFMDEIGELSLEAQALLLRALQERTIDPVGGDSKAVNIRILAATNRRLQADVAEGRFRSDLFHRLSVFPIHVPPLREHQSDIPILALEFMKQFSARHNRPARRITNASLRDLTAYPWPGNIRELQNIIERAVIVSTSETLAFEASWLTGAAVTESSSTWAAQERQRILDALKATGGRIYGPGGAAQRLGLKPTTLYGKMRKHKLHRPECDWE